MAADLDSLTIAGLMLPKSFANPDDRLMLLAAARVALRSCESPMLLEIGTWQGGMAVLLGAAAREYSPDARVICVDPFYVDPTCTGSSKIFIGEPYFEGWRNRVCEFGMKRIILAVVAQAPEAAILIPSVALCAIDGEHSAEAVLLDLQTYSSRLERNGLIYLHDYYGFAGVKQGVQDFIALYPEWHSLPWFQGCGDTAVLSRNAETLDAVALERREGLQ